MNIKIVQGGSFIFCAMLALTVAGGIQSARAITTTLMPSADSSMRDVAANTNFGESNPLLIGNAKEPFVLHNRALLKFDLTGIPTNATVTGVTLTVMVFRSNTDPADFDLNRVLVDWSEYEVTWNNRSASTPWLSGGGQSGTEFVAAASVTATVDDTLFSSAGMVSDVQLWVRNSSTNFGWMMQPTGDLGGTGKQLGSRESEFTSVLTVEYTLTPSASPPVLYGAAKVANGFRFSFNTQSNRPYAVEFCDALGTGTWNTLTNVPAQPADSIVDITNVVFLTERYFRVRTP